MKLDLSIQRAGSNAGPTDDELQHYVLETLPSDHHDTELCIRIVEAEEGAQLNEKYRDKTGPTNVLSFPCDVQISELKLLGDLVICAPVVAKEAEAQSKPEPAHWAHMVVHGVLHLLGYDHIGEHDALLMEAEERAILARLGFPDPYLNEKPNEGA